MEVDGDKIQATDKTLQIASNGLPASIQINGEQVLAKPFRFVIVTNKGPVSFDATDAVLKKDANGLVSWKSSYSKDGIHFTNYASMEYDGYVHYDLQVFAEQDMVVKDVRLETDYTPYASEYFMGTGFGGGFRPVSHQWNWEGPWDSYWMGNAKAGLHVEYRGGGYHGPLLNDYKPAAPRAWSNHGKGTVPPLKPLEPANHFSERYYHAEHTGFDKAAEEGANIINIHHAKPLNPVINYPFIVRDSLIGFIKHEHEFGRKVKLYYTIRELTNYVQEIYALKSLKHEIFVSGPGYGLPWHCEHLIDDYRAAWYSEMPNETSDAALVLNGFSRWINYYLEGLRWMFENYDLDGIYMDDVSFDRPVMKRMRKIMNQYHPGALIDLHSNTWYSVGPANQYTGFFPYVDRLWFGESFMYDEMSPANWLVEVSGIPFGLMGDMLHGGGNKWLGMQYGMTVRQPWMTEGVSCDPQYIWKLWDDFGIMDAQMVGFWEDNPPVTSSDPSSVRMVAPAIADFQEAQEFTPGIPIPVDPKRGWLIILSE